MQNQYYKMRTPYVAIVGGPDISLRISLLKLLKNNGINVVALGTNINEKAVFDAEGIPFFLYNIGENSGLIAIIKSFFEIYKIFKKEKFDIVHAFDTKPTIIARIAARLAKIPVIIGTIPGLGSIFSERHILNKSLGVIYIITQKIACKVSDTTIFQNEDDRDFFIHKKIIERSKVFIIRGSGVDTEKFRFDAVDIEYIQRLKRELQLQDSLVISMISRLVKYKGIKEYLAAAKVLKQKYPNITFLLVGPEDSTRAAFPLKELSRYSSVVKYIGMRNDIREILYLSDIVVLPTYYREGIPRVLLEGASMGKPLVATKLPGCKDVIEDGVNGFLVLPKDHKDLSEAIERLILSEELRKKMGILSRNLVKERFSLNIVFKETIDIYFDLLKKKMALVYKLDT